MTASKIPLWPFLLLTLLYCCSIIIDTMDVDASQYAYLSSEMLQTGHYLHVYEHGYPYLDKPPLLFWITSQFMRVFGLNNVGFKLPSILFALAAIYATYRTARLHYGDFAARLSALILATTQAMFLMTNDIRTDTMLMSWVIIAIWYWNEWYVSASRHWLLAAYAAMAMAMMTKGPIGFIAPMTAIGVDWLIKKQWRHVFNQEHILGLALMFVLLLPMNYGLYTQFDLHPELVVNGKTHVSGLRFFWWTQSFGRITGENTWNNNAPFSFLFENMLWAFLPWTLIFIIAYIKKWRVFFFAKRAQQLKYHEWQSLFGFTLVYGMLGISHYQLPHYLFVVYPLAAILAGSWLAQILNQRNIKWIRTVNVMQTAIGLLLLLASFLIVNVVFPQQRLLGTLVATALLLLFCYVWLKTKPDNQAWRISAATALLLNIMLTFFFYTNLLSYQASSNVGRYLRNALPKPVHMVALLDRAYHGLFFYGNLYQAPRVHTAQAIPPLAYVLTDTAGIRKMNKLHLKWDTVYAHGDFKVSQLNGKFLNYTTRPEVTDTVYLLKLVH